MRKDSDYDTLLEDAKTRLKEAQADVEAIERVRRMKKKLGMERNSQSTEENPEAPPPSNPPKLPGAAKGELMKVVKDYIASHHGTFTMRDVFKEISEAGKIKNPVKGSIKAALGALEEKKEIETVTRGSGRKPSIYRKTK